MCDLSRKYSTYMYRPIRLNETNFRVRIVEHEYILKWKENKTRFNKHFLYKYHKRLAYEKLIRTIRLKRLRIVKLVYRITTLPL